VPEGLSLSLNATVPWYADILQVWEPLIRCTQCTPEMRARIQHVDLEHFARFGFYSVTFRPPAPRSALHSSQRDGRSARKALVVVALNTLLWQSTDVFARVRDPSAPSSAHRRLLADTEVQLRWLERLLAKAKAEGNTVMCASHVPPGLSVYHGANANFNVTTQTRFLRLLLRYQAESTLSLYGHYHEDTWRAIDVETEAGIIQPVAFLLSPAISPVYGNNPGFRTVTLDTQHLRVVDYTQYYMDIVAAAQRVQANSAVAEGQASASEWVGPQLRELWRAGYSFVAEYGVAMDAEAMRNATKELHRNMTLYRQYRNHQYLEHAGLRPDEVCGTHAATVEAWKACMLQWGKFDQRVQGVPWDSKTRYSYCL